MVGTVPVWPPPSVPCTMIASAPSCSAFTAWRSAPQVGTHTTPASLSLAMSFASGERL